MPTPKKTIKPRLPGLSDKKRLRAANPQPNVALPPIGPESQATGDNDRREFGLAVTEVRVQGFRSLGDVTVSLSSRTTVLVGENNTGKTSLLEALATAIGGRRARLEDLQRTKEGPVKAATIDLRITPLGDDFPDTATEVFGSAIQGISDVPYVGLRARIDLDELRRDVRLTRQYLKDWDKGTALKEPYVAQTALDLINFEMLDARRDILDQIRNRSSLLGRTLSGGAVAPQLRTEVEAQLRALADRLRTGVPGLVQLRKHLKALAPTLPRSVLAVDIDPVPQSLDEIARAIDLRVDDDAGTFQAAALGMGTRALAALLVFRAFIDVARGPLDPRTSASLAAFEEPEAHLHPQAQRAVVNVLGDIPGQTIVSTHAGEIVAQSDINAIRVFRREKGKATVRAYTGGPAPGSEDGIKLRRFVLTHNASAIFARAVIVVEGRTEGSLLPILADAWWAPKGGYHANGVQIISTDGSGSCKHIVPALDSWGIPWSTVLDADTAEAVLEGVSTGLGRPITSSSREVVLVSPRLEEYLLGLTGYREIVFEIGRAWPDGSIDDWLRLRHGQKAKGGLTRDYQSAGWEERVAIDWLREHKGTVGESLGRGILSRKEKDGSPRLPPAFRDLFERVDAQVT